MNDTEKVIQSLLELELIRDSAEGELWLESEKIPAFGKTGAELIQAGSLDALLAELVRLSEGGYA